MPKRLIICCDGTWNKFDQDQPSNLRRLVNLLKRTDNTGMVQCIFYQAGVGTRWFDRLPGGAFGTGIDQKIQDAYQFLCLNYTDGDEIYLFGYSRGAYTVRSLGGLIDCVGLLPAHKTQFQQAGYDIYRIHNAKDRDEERQAQADRFRATHQTKRPHIKLLGCWDTVGALGIPDLTPILPIDRWANRKYRFHNTDLSRLIEHALHVAALDEQQQVFCLTPMNVPRDSPTQLQQCWLPGDHGRVGSSFGGPLGDLALVWMVEAIARLNLGLAFDTDAVAALNPDPLGGEIPNLFAQKANGKLPFLQRFMRLKPRELMQNGQTIVPNAENQQIHFHPGVRQRWCNNATYRPTCLIDQGWKSVFDAAC